MKHYPSILKISKLKISSFFLLQLRREMLIFELPREKFVIAVDKIQFVIRCSLSITLKLETLKFTDNLVVVSIGHRKEF